MKKTLFLYIAKEMLLYFAIAFFFFFLIFFVNQILLMAEEVLSKKAPFFDVVKLIFYSLPSVIATSAPFAALVGTLMGVGRLVSDREILSMNTLGISVRFIILPVLAVGILVSVVSFATNDILLPAGTIQFNKLYRKILTATPALELESNSIKRNERAIVITGTIRNSVMDKLLVVDTDDEGNKRIIASPEAEIIKSETGAILMSLRMNDSSVVMFDRKDPGKYDLVDSEIITYNILAKNVLPAYTGSITPREMSSRDLFREIRNSKEQHGDRRLNMMWMEFHKKFSIPFGAFFFVLLAFPLALTTKHSGQSTGFIIGLFIAVFYWSLLIGGQTLSVRLGFNGSIMMWLPNTVILILGLLCTGRKIFT